MHTTDDELSPIIDTQRTKSKKRRFLCNNSIHKETHETFLINTSKLMKSASFHASNNSLTFCRSEYVKNILNQESRNVLCVVISTFTLDIENLSLEMPFLMEKESSVATLIQYGKGNDIEIRCIF